MKKFLGIAISTLMVGSMLIGCGGSEEAEVTTVAETEVVEVETEAVEVETEAVEVESEEVSAEEESVEEVSEEEVVEDTTVA